jgi:hypothetical protein
MHHSRQVSKYHLTGMPMTPIELKTGMLNPQRKIIAIPNYVYRKSGERHKPPLCNILYIFQIRKSLLFSSPAHFNKITPM